MARRLSSSTFLVGDKVTTSFALTVLSIFSEAELMQNITFKQFLEQDPEDLINAVLSLLNTHINGHTASEKEKAASQLIALVPLLTSKLAYAVSPTYYDHFQRYLGAPARQEPLPGTERH